MARLRNVSSAPVDSSSESWLLPGLSPPSAASRARTQTITSGIPERPLPRVKDRRHSSEESPQHAQPRATSPAEQRAQQLQNQLASLVDEQLAAAAERHRLQAELQIANDRAMAAEATSAELRVQLHTALQQLAHYERAAYGLSGLYDQNYAASLLSIPQQDCGLSFHSALCEDGSYGNHAINM